jgi:hypothetical protein
LLGAAEPCLFGANIVPDWERFCQVQIVDFVLKNTKGVSEMTAIALPKKQINHKYIDRSIARWLGIHFGDTSFNGRVVLGRRKNGGGIYTMSVRSLNELRPYVMMVHASNRLDYYITANTVSGVNRRESELFGLQNIVIDIDVHDKERRRDVPRLIQAFLWRCKRDLWGTGAIPSPNSIVRTGRGVQLWWAIQPCYGGSDYGKSRYHYDKIKNNFMDHIEVMLNEYDEELNGLEVDRGASSNPVGYFRLPCTYNTTAKCYSTLEILHDKRYDQRELTLLDRPEIEVPVRTSETKHVPMSSTDLDVIRKFHSTGLRRVLQLIKLRNLRNNEVGAETRDLFNFAVYNSLRMSFDHHEAMSRLQAFNAGFKEPMSDDELTNCISSAEKKGGYKYTNIRLIELLGVTQEEQDAVGLHPFHGKYAPWSHAKPNSSRDEARRAIRENRDHQILELSRQGVSQVEIARRLEIGKNTVGRVLKKLNTEIDTVLMVGEPQEECHQNGSIYVLFTSEAAGEVSVPGGHPHRGLFVLPRSDQSRERVALSSPENSS